MHCGSCEQIVADTLLELKGVRKVDASFKKGQITVDFDDKVIKTALIKQTIEKEGYQVNA
jgi:copper chaperone CopZ